MRLQKVNRLLGFIPLPYPPNTHITIIIAESKYINNGIIVDFIQIGIKLDAINGRKRTHESMNNSEIRITVQRTYNRDYLIIQARHQQVSVVRRPVYFSVLPLAIYLCSVGEIQIYRFKLFPIQTLPNNDIIFGVQSCQILVESIPDQAQSLRIQL